MTHKRSATPFAHSSCTPYIPAYVTIFVSLVLFLTIPKTTSPLFQKSAFSVLRRYSDFLWLYETLSNNNPGVVVPPVPEKNTFGRFDDQFVRQRRFALEKCIHKIANHPVLGKDPDLKLFLESDTFSLDVRPLLSSILFYLIVYLWSNRLSTARRRSRRNVEDLWRPSGRALQVRDFTRQTRYVSSTLQISYIC